MFMHSFAASFSIKTYFYKTINIPSPTTTLVFAKLSGVPGDTFRIFTYFSSYFCIEMRLPNIFKNVNAITLARIILEVPYKVM